MPSPRSKIRRALISGVIVFIWLAFAAQALFAATRYRFDVWTTDDGLPQNTVNGLIQTRDRYIWFATTDGIVRFDGVRFKVFNRANTPVLPSNRFNNAVEDAAGRIWFQTEVGQVVLVENGTFSVLQYDDGTPVIIRGNLDLDEHLDLTMNANGRLLKYKDKRLVPFDLPTFGPESTLYHIDRRGGYWIHDGGANFRRLIDGRVISWPQFGARNPIPTSVHEDRFGRFWTRSVDGFLALINDGEIVGFPLQISKSSRFCEDADGNLLIPGTAGFYRINAADFSAAKISASTAEFFPIDQVSSDTNVFSTLIDTEGGVWFGTDRNGLVHVTPHEVRVLSKTDWKTTDENVYPILERRNGDVILGAWERSLVKVAPDGSFSLLATLPPMTLPSLLFEDSTGVLWFGNRSLYYRDGEVFKPLSPPPRADDAAFTSAFEDRFGSLWFGSDAGLFRVRNRQMEYFPEIGGTRGKGITTIIGAAGNDGFWVGTTAGAILVGIDGPQNPPVVRSSLTVADGLAGDHVRSLYQEPDGTLWIGTYDSGLSRFRDGRIANFLTDQGMFSNNVFCIVEDANGWFWMNSNQGIYRILKKNLNDVADGRATYLTSIAYTKKDGLLSSEGNGGKQPSALRRTNGEIWFPTLRGVAVIDSLKVVKNSLPPTVRIEDVFLDRRDVGRLDGRVVVEPSQSSLQINYTGLSFVNSPLVKFRYRLVGVDESWIEAGSQRSAFYNYLPSGEYEFQVTAANRDGVWADEIATIKIVVKPHFYQTWWFITAVGVSVALLIWFAYAVRVGQLKRIGAARSAFAEQLIESQEAERKRIAAELHDGLGQTLAMIHNNALLGAEETTTVDSATDKFRTISEQTGHAIGEVREIAYNLRPYLLDRLGLTRALRSLAAKVAASHRLELNDRIDEIDGLLRPNDEMSVYRIVQETLSNVLKHAAATKLDVHVTREENEIRIFIRDDGRGFDLGKLRRGEPGAGGFGLLSLSERVRLLGGTEHVGSEPGKGTVVEILIYIPKPVITEDND